MKKLATVLFVLFACVALFASAAPEAVDTTDYSNMSLDQIKAAIKTVTPGKLTVATSPDFAPYEFYAIDENGSPKLAGFDMALAAYIAQYLGLELDVIPMDFDGTIMELSLKTVDLGIAGYSNDPERAETMDFSDVYLTGKQSFVCLKKNAANFPNLEATNDAKWTIAAQTGSIQMGLAEEFSPKADILALTKVTDIIAELLAGTINGAYVETMVAETYAKNYPELEVLLDVPYAADGSVVGVSKGNAALLAGVNKAIQQVLSDGTMGKFIEEANILSEGNIYEGLLENK